MSQLVAAAKTVAPAILNALKLDLKNVTRLELDFNAHDLAFCRIEFYPTPEQLENVTEALETQMKCYALAELDCSQQSHEQ
jgi:hypothetical protein